MSDTVHRHQQLWRHSGAADDGGDGSSNFCDGGSGNQHGHGNEYPNGDGDHRATDQHADARAEVTLDQEHRCSFFVRISGFTPNTSYTVDLNPGGTTSITSDGQGTGRTDNISVNSEDPFTATLNGHTSDEFLPGALLFRRSRLVARRPRQMVAMTGSRQIRKSRPQPGSHRICRANDA